jgi:hypothetical protein
MGDVPSRDAPVPPTEPVPEPEAPESETEEAETEEAQPKKNWAENFNVKQKEVIETVDRLNIVTGVNEYKGNFLVFMAKVTDKDFSRQFYSMQAYVWLKALPTIEKMAKSIAEVEKKAMADKVMVELKRLKELGIDVTALAGKV